MSDVKVHFVSEPVQHQGNVMADMMTASIATSAYSQAATFLRETLQNASDQKPEGIRQIKFIVDAYQVTGKKKLIFDDFFANARLGTDPLKLRKLKESKTFEALVVADVGTVGLTGPLDASIDETPSNFAGFFFNVGRPNEESSKAGSFGLGRTVLTSASDFSTILVYSQFNYKGKQQKRFMGMSLAGAFSAGGRKFTGRHWFGQAPGKDSGLIHPFEGKNAEKLASDMGMLKYLDGDTGFVALVVGNALVANPGSTTLAKQQREQSIADIQEAACIYGWPHMLGTKKQRSVEFHFLCDNNERPEKNPKEMPGLQDFVLCYESLGTHQDGVNRTEIMFSETSKKEATGTLTWVTVPTTSSDLELEKNGLIPKCSVALMREANFVVKYLEVTQSADQISTRGVFKANGKYDARFRKSEPVAHDDWIPAKLQLKPNARNPIKQTLENIKKNFNELAGKRTSAVEGTASVVLGNVIGRLLDGLALTGPPKPPKGGTGLGGGTGGGSRGPQVVPVGSPRIVKSDLSSYEAVFKFQYISPKDYSDASDTEFSAYAILENGSPELEPPDGVEVPKIIEILVDGKPTKSISKITLVESMSMKNIEVKVSCPQGIGSICRAKVAVK